MRPPISVKQGSRFRINKKTQRGATMVEYAIMVAVFAVFLIAAVIIMRGAVEEGFTSVCDAIAEGIENSDIDCTPAAAP